MKKTLEHKLAAIHADPAGCREFLIADAKDADMAFGIGAPGMSPERHDGELRFRTLAEYREQIRLIVRQADVDIMLMSASTSEVLTLQDRLFDDSPVTPAIRANDTTDIWVFRGSRIGGEASRPFRSASIDHAQCGRLDCGPDERTRGANLGLYSITFNNDRDRDLEALECYAQFRDEAERKGFRHFLEVFYPNVSGVVAPELLPQFICDAIVRTLAGVTSSSRPMFLKIPFPGPRVLEELVAYDPHLVVGVLGGSAGTTRDAFQLIADARRHGARIALFGRKINQAENQLAFIRFLRLIVEDALSAEEAVRAYHSVLEKLGLHPHRPLSEDQELTSTGTSYGGGGSTRRSTSVGRNGGEAAGGSGSGATDAKKLTEMTAEERLAYHRARLNRALGE
ncbi:MAG: hypothetical protein KF774_02700 [Planctomyces sp.]|nr:hypothetical protein [Planctomyces sp.]